MAGSMLVLCCRRRRGIGIMRVVGMRVHVVCRFAAVVRRLRRRRGREENGGEEGRHLVLLMFCL